MADRKANALELIEINLLFAKGELSIETEENSTARALYHIEEALRLIREQPSGKKTDCDLVPHPPQV